VTSVWLCVQPRGGHEIDVWIQPRSAERKMYDECPLSRRTWLPRNTNPSSRQKYRTSFQHLHSRTNQSVKCVFDELVKFMPLHQCNARSILSRTEIPFETTLRLAHALPSIASSVLQVPNLPPLFCVEQLLTDCWVI
jgi:hypothetical protein